MWINTPQQGYVGVGRVLGAATPANEFTVTKDGDERPILGVAIRANYHAAFADDPDRREYFVPVQWLQTVQVGQAVREIGMFGNQNTVCRPRTPKWRSTIERLKEHFPHSDDMTAT
ncbi:hypothetical protein PPUJ20028_05310 [Pseudomonas putida]|uniref:Uncharacterized protein n=1 Tax=Pseudomonas putida TaxID=303 RepID=A0AA37RBS5_PSEPU|nr:hypothetical protein PPUJ20028_05310 [Pseudomonas putida]GLO34078.1 hypothetical protein PPUN14671_09110 [Pseudomonas putida]